jgi:hypothetical protein
MRTFWKLYYNHTAKRIDEAVKAHVRTVIQTKFRHLFGLKCKPRPKPVLGSEWVIYLQYYRWVRDESSFNLGLDRLDDATLRLLYMWTGCRKHELVFAKPQNRAILIKELNNDPDAFSSPEEDDPFVQRHVGSCWVCSEAEERERDDRLKVLCWEDIDLWISRDPYRNGGRDRLVMQVLLRYHKGEERKRVPTWFILIEEDNPLLCPVSHLLAKALAEGVIENPGYQSAEMFFNTRLTHDAVKIRWKKDWLHKPVFRDTVPTLAGFDKSDEPHTAGKFDNRTRALGKDSSIEEDLTQYCSRRGFANPVACKYIHLPLVRLSTNNSQAMYSQQLLEQALRHKPNSSVYQEFYQSNNIHIIGQDAVLRRAAQTPYLAIFNFIGLRCDEDAPR